MTAGFVGSPVPERAAKLMTDEQWLRAVAKYDKTRPNHSWEFAKGGAQELAGLLGRQAKTDPDRFARLAMTFTRDTHPAYITHAIDAVAANIPTDLLAEICTHARSIAGSAAGSAVCHAVMTVAANANDALVDLLEHYARDPDPEHEPARTSSHQTPSGDDLQIAGMNCIRGQAAEAIGDVLFAQPRYADRMLATVAALVSDPILAVRSQATIPVTALLNTHPETAIAHATQLFNEPTVGVYASEPAARLLTYALLREPRSFAAHLTRALRGPTQVAERAGRIWVIAKINDRFDASSVATAALPAAARRGIARILAAEPGLLPDLLVDYFNDPDTSVRSEAASAIRQLGEVAPQITRSLATSFATSEAFVDHFDRLFHALEQHLALQPDTILRACDRAIDVAGADLGNIRTSHAAASRDVVAVVLRLYRTGNSVTRIHCLDVIDSLSDIDSYGLEDALLNER